MMSQEDTIVALATPAGVALRAIVRTSGPRAVEFARRLCHAERSEEPLPPVDSSVRERYRLSPCGTGPEAIATVLSVRGVAFPVTLLIFRAPRSATGEDVVEYHVPGSPWIASALIDRLFALGARQAEPGEFSSRAFFHGKIDLAAAEGIVATISASNRESLAAARQLMSGELARRLMPAADRLIHALALIEAEIDFSDEDVSFLDRATLLNAVASTRAELTTLLEQSRVFERLDHEPRIVLIGRPNAGKSSLLNALADDVRAVVADVAGTTRDALSARVPLADGFVTLVDVAGLDDAGALDAIASDMRLVALRQLEEADFVVQVHAADDPNPPLTLPRTASLLVRSKSDLGIDFDPLAIPASVRLPDGLEPLRSALNERAFHSGAAEFPGAVAINLRHRRAIEQAIEALDRAADQLDAGKELVAAELRFAIDAVGQVLGRVSPDDVLGRIFTSFCIGK